MEINNYAGAGSARPGWSTKGSAPARPEKENSFQTTAEMMDFIRRSKEEIYDRVRKGETEVKIQTGASQYTQKQWNRMIESFDKAQDDIRRQLKEAKEQRRKAQAEKEVGQNEGI